MRTLQNILSFLRVCPETSKIYLQIKLFLWTLVKLSIFILRKHKKTISKNFRDSERSVSTAGKAEYHFLQNFGFSFTSPQLVKDNLVQLYSFAKPWFLFLVSVHFVQLALYMDGLISQTISELVFLALGQNRCVCILPHVAFRKDMVSVFVVQRKFVSEFPLACMVLLIKAWLSGRPFP